MPRAPLNFTSVWCILVAVEDLPGERLKPLALGALDISTTGVVQIGVPKLWGIRRPPYPTGPQALIVTIDAQLLAGLHLALGWRLPERVIDLMVEFKNDRRSARPMVGGLAGAAMLFGHSASAGLATGSSPERMRRRLTTLFALFNGLVGSLDTERALLRGRYLCSVARIEAVGVPVDGPFVGRLAAEWPTILDRVIVEIDRSFGVYHGRRFDVEAFCRLLKRLGIDWPRTMAGGLDFDDATFREMAKAHPVLCPLRELRATLFGFDPQALFIGRDDRNRVPLRPFASSTGRNQPSTKASLLGSPAWVRHLIMPRSGTGLALLDWQQQEFGIAAALSGDVKMRAAYRSGDPYMALAIEAGALPVDVSAASHSHVRERFKRCALGMQYGMGRARLARHLGTSECDATAMIASHKAAFPEFWSWSDEIETYGMLHRELRSVFGWRLTIDENANPRSIRNFPMQANGAEMLRLACCLMTEAGISVCAPNHDAVMIEAPLCQFDATIAEAQRLMEEASVVVLDGFALRTSVRTVRAPDRWTDPRGKTIWKAVRSALSDKTTCSRT